MTNYHLLSCWLHKIKYNQDKEAVLLISEINLKASELCKKAIELQVFDKALVFKDRSLRKQRKTKLNENSSKKVIMKEVKHYTKKIKEALPVNPKDFEEINIALDHWPLGIYLIYNNIPYNYFEDGNGLLSRPEILTARVIEADPYMHFMGKALNTYGSNKLIVNAYADLDNQADGFMSNNAVHFSIKEILNTLNKDDINKLLLLFDVPKISDMSDNQKTTLVLTQPYITISRGRMGFFDQRHLYSLLIDYFAPKSKLFFKAHPMDIFLTYEDEFKGCIVFDRFMPSELLPFSLNKKFDIGLTACSTSIFGLSDCIKKMICFTPQIEKTYPYIHRYYTAALILNNFIENNIYVTGIDIPLFSMINTECLYKDIKVKEIDFSNINHGFYVIDSLYDIDRQEFEHKIINLSADDIIIYLNTDNNFLFLSDNFNMIKDYSIPITIEKHRNSDGHFNSSENEVIFVFTKNQKIREQINTMKEEKTLLNSDLKIVIDQKDYQDVKELKAILEATEQYLKESLAENKKLRQLLSNKEEN